MPNFLRALGTGSAPFEALARWPAVQERGLCRRQPEASRARAFVRSLCAPPCRFARDGRFVEGDVKLLQFSIELGRFRVRPATSGPSRVQTFNYGGSG